MHCTGCWAAEYGYKQNLSYEVMDKVLTEGKEFGIHACLFTGGEPLVRKKDIIRLCEKHQDVAFHALQMAYSLTMRSAGSCSEWVISLCP